jgi:hypothetical protein
MAEGLEALLRSAQAALSAASQRRYPPPKSGAQKLRRSSRWRSLEQGLWRTDRCRCGRAAPEAVAALADGARRCVRVRNTRTRKRGFFKALIESEERRREESSRSSSSLFCKSDLLSYSYLYVSLSDPGRGLDPRSGVGGAGTKFSV